MKFNWFILFICLSCGKAHSQKIVINHSTEGIIFSAKKPLPILIKSVRFTPPKNEVILYETELAANVISEVKLHNKKPIADSIIKNLYNGSFGRQYFGFIKDGKKVLLVCYILKNSFKDWDKGVLFVEDGGWGYFRIYVDVKSKKIINSFFDQSRVLN